MARNVTDLVYAIYGHDKTASKALRGVGNESKTTADKLAHIGKVAAASFATAGAAAIAFGVSAAKAAVEDEKSQKMLAKTLQNTVKATKEQIAASEKFISKMQLTYGIADDKLRPAFSTLARATRDTAEAQDLLQVAMDVSAGTGKDLSTVSLALAKAYNGNLGALTRLGIPMDKAIIKNKDFKAALDVLTKTFTGSAKVGTETFAGKMAILQQNFNESKEQLGYALLPTLTTFSNYILENVVPNVQLFIDGLTGVQSEGDKASSTAYKLGEDIRNVVKYLKDNEGFLKGMGIVIGSIFIGAKAYAAVNAMAGALSVLRGAFAATTAIAATTAAAEAAATGGASLYVSTPAIAAIVAAFGIAGLGAILAFGKPRKGGEGPVTGGDIDKPATRRGRGGGSAVRNRRAVGGSVATGTSYLIGENGPELFTPANGGMITRSENLRGGIGGMNVVVNVSGSVIHEKDLAVTVRDNIAQLMRRRGLDPAILGV